MSMMTIKKKYKFNNTILWLSVSKKFLFRDCILELKGARTMWRFGAKKIVENKKLVNDNYQLLCSWTDYLLEAKTVQTEKSEIKLIQGLVKLHRVTLFKKDNQIIDCSLPNNQFIKTSEKLFSDFRPILSIENQTIKLPSNMNIGNLQGYFYEQLASGFFVNMLNVIGYAKEKPIVKTSSVNQSKMIPKAYKKPLKMDFDLIAGENVAEVKSGFSGFVTGNSFLTSEEEEILAALQDELGKDFLGFKLESKGLIIVQKATSQLVYFTEGFQKQLANKFFLNYITLCYMDQEDFYIVENMNVRAIEDSNAKLAE